ncbi:hypothetical protein K8R66_03120, partial [bacterium]|nr:hypothetical protein [bacterium]
MNFWTSVIISIVLLIVTIVIFAMKILYPYHRVLALSIYFIGWIFFIYSIFLKKQWLLQHKETVTSFFSAFYVHIIFGIIMLGAIYLLFILFPAEKSSFIGLDDKIVSQIINEDQTIILYLDKKLSTNLNSAIEKNIFEIDFKNVTDKEKDELKNFWILYIEGLLELDLLKEKYKTFYQLNPVIKKDLHQKSFDNGYTAFLAQHYYMLQLTEKIKDQNIITFLNEELVDQGIESGNYDMLKDKLADSNELLRLNTGRVYRLSIINENTGLSDLVNKY